MQIASFSKTMQIVKILNFQDDYNHLTEEQKATLSNIDLMLD